MNCNICVGICYLCYDIARTVTYVSVFIICVMTVEMSRYSVTGAQVCVRSVQNQLLR